MSAEFARFIAEMPVAVALFDRSQRYLSASREWVEVFGLPRAPYAGRPHEAVSKIARAPLADVLRRGLAGECVASVPIVENRLPEKSVFSARPHRDDNGTITGVIVALRPAPVALLGHAMPMTDPLTGLAERRDFARRLRDILAEPEAERRSVAVFAINLDNLRTITNLHGPAAADEALKVTAGRLVSGTRSGPANDHAANDDAGNDGATRRSDLVARLGPEQFGIVSGRLMPAGEAEGLAARFLRIAQNPIATSTQSLRLNASAAFIMTGDAHASADDVFRDLDLALQQAQTVGPNRVVGWEPALTASASKRYSLAEQLRQGFDNGEFALHYHPVMRLRDDKMVGVEALLRWNHPSEGLVAPAAFLPVLEESGLILEVGCWIVREAVRQVESWQMLYGRELVEWIAINVSAREFIDPKPLLNTLRSIHEGGFSVGRLKFEIAEPALTRSPEISRAALTELERFGISVAIDDFGTGHSSLTSLRDYRVDTIKIDSAFIGQIGTRHGDKLVDALIDIAHGYGASVIAEGIETSAQYEFLRRSGCELGQGYLFAEPMDGAHLGAYALMHLTGGEAAARDAGRGGSRPTRTSAGPSPAMSAGAAHSGRPAR